METLHNQTVFKCSYCTKISKSAAAMHSHEISCKNNPNTQYPCASCSHCKRVVSYEEHGTKCNHCYHYNAWENECTNPDCGDDRIRIVDFICDIDGAKMYSPKKVLRMNKETKNKILCRCDRPMKNIVEGCENYEFNYGD